MSITKISPSVVDFDSGITISTADNTSNLTLTSTDADANIAPLMQLYRNSSSPADNDQTGRIEFNARNDNSQDVNYATIVSQILDASDGAEDGRFAINTMVAGTSQSRIDIRASETVINNESLDLDFRVESDGNANTFIVDGGTDEVRVPHDIAAQSLASFIVRENGAAFEFGHQNNTGQYYGTLGAFGSNGDPYIGFATDCESSLNTFTTRGSKGCLITNGSGDMRFMAVTSASATGQTPSERVRIRNDGGITFNGDTAAANALDDYEEGTWTPSITAGGWSIDSTGSATYTKIGRVVHVNVYTSITGTGNGDDFTMSGLPFNPASNHFATGKVDAEKVNTHGAYVRSQPGTAHFIFLNSEESTSTGRTVLDGNEFGAGYIIFSMTYFV